MTDPILPSGPSKPRTKLPPVAKLVIPLAALLLVWIVVMPVITGTLMESGTAEMLEKAKKVHLAVQQMAKDGAKTGNKSLGYPADAGITSAAELKKRLVENKYLTAAAADALPFDTFRFGNVSANDPEKTIFVRIASDQQGLSAVLRKSGDTMILQPDLALAAADPPRDPAYLPAK